MDIVLAQLVACAGRLAAADGAGLFTSHASGHSVSIACSGSLAGFQGMRELPGASLALRCLRSGQRLRVNRRQEQPAVMRDQAERIHTESMLYVPLLDSQGAVRAVLVLAAGRQDAFPVGGDGPIDDIAAAIETVLHRQSELRGGGVASDITERKVMDLLLRDSEARLQRSENDLRALLAGLADGVVIHRGGTIRYANAAAAVILGAASAAELEGRHLRTVMVGEDLAPLEADLATLQSGQSNTNVRRVQRPDGTSALIEGHSSLVVFGGSVAFAVSLRDVTRRRAQEQRAQLSERLAAVGTLASAIAHEINNPLAFLMTNLSLLAEALCEIGGALPAARIGEMLAMTKEAHAGAERIRLMVRAMRTLAHDTSQEKLAPIGLDPAIQAAVQLTGNEIRQRARLVQELRPTPLVLADDAHLTQVLVRLLTNAWQAIPPGDPERHCVRIVTSTAPDGQAVIEVSDDGVGVAPEQLRRIFDPFFTTRPAGEGLGLGLSIVHGIVVSLGGQIEAESELGGGMRLRMMLPAAPTVAPGPPATPGAASPRRRVVLIVDDEEAMGRALFRALQSDHEVVVTTSGADALAVLEIGSVDVILLDLQMPVMSGMEFYAQLQQRHPAMAQRVMFMTGGAFTDEARQFLREVTNPRMDKPLDVPQLRARIASLMERAP